MPHSEHFPCSEYNSHSGHPISRDVKLLDCHVCPLELFMATSKSKMKSKKCVIVNKTILPILLNQNQVKKEKNSYKNSVMFLTLKRLLKHSLGYLQKKASYKKTLFVPILMGSTTPVPSEVIISWPFYDLSKSYFLLRFDGSANYCHRGLKFTLLGRTKMQTS